MIFRYLFAVVLACCINQALAFPCYLTLVKDNCWLDYNVTVNIMNSKTGADVLTVIVPQGQAWVRQPFICQPEEVLSFKAKFTPVFWTGDEDKIYSGQLFWTLPKAIKAGETAWNITLCYPDNFSGVPLPPQATANCRCDLKSIPAIEEQ